MTALILLSKFRETEIEIWRPVEGYPDYDVSNLGRLRSWIKTVSTPTGDWRGARFQVVRQSEPFLLHPSPHRRKWRKVSLGKGTLCVHQIVARAFIPNPQNYPQVNHLNAIGSDNRALNLEWTDHDGNHKHATIHGLRKWGEGVWHRARLTEADVRMIREMRAKGIGSTALAKMFGVERSTIKRAVNGKTWRRLSE